MNDLLDLLWIVLGSVLIGGTLLETFESILLPRTMKRRLWLTRLFYHQSWRVWRGVARRFPPRHSALLLDYYGSLALLLMLSVFAVCLIIGFALLHLGLDTRLVPDRVEPVSFGVRLYLSGVVFFTLGFGDVTPLDTLGRFLTVVESGLGFGFLAAVISYLPVFYQAFNEREVAIFLLEERAGARPSAGTLLYRHGTSDGDSGIRAFLADWERWAAEVFSSHLSHPLLCFFRSQNDDQSWLSALTMVLDVCTLVQVGIEGVPQHQARLTFAMARQTVVGLERIFRATGTVPVPERAAPGLAELRTHLAHAGLVLHDDPAAEQCFTELRQQYEPHVAAFAAYLCVTLPPWIDTERTADTWQPPYAMSAGD